MNIFEMLSFDFKEFVTSTPGILIIAGILCLLVGIVMNLKDKKKNASESEAKEEAPAKEATTEAPAPQEAATEAPAAPVVESVAETTPLVVPSDGEGVKEVPVEPLAETINFNEPSSAAPVVEELKAEALDMPTAPEEPASEAPAVVAPVESLEAAPEPASQPTVYGGVSPEVLRPEVLEEKPREIYGGANPLENTAPIPTVTETATTAPVVEAPAPAPEPETAAPVVEAPAPAPEPETVAPVVEAPAPAPEPETAAPVVEAPAPAPAAPAEEKKEEIEKLEF